MTRPIACTPLDAMPSELIEEITAAGLDPEPIHRAIAVALAEDLPNGSDDVTSAATIPAAARGEAVFGARADGVLAGLVVAEMVFRYCLDDVVVEHRLPDSTAVRTGDVVLRVAGPIRGLLTAERTALNFACHLSGVATATARWVDAIAGSGASVLDTRKTLPGYRALQKYAVRCGGGVNHRFSLSDLALIKDNHVLAAGGVVPAIQAVRRQFGSIPIEVEVTTLVQLRELLTVGCERILLDNMSDEMMAEAVSIRDATGSSATLEASGGLTLERAAAVASTGVDFISVGELTHSVRVFDLGMDLIEP